MCKQNIVISRVGKEYVKFSACMGDIDGVRKARHSKTFPPIPFTPSPHWPMYADGIFEECASCDGGFVGHRGYERFI